jgi:hypothetical protein
VLTSLFAPDSQAILDRAVNPPSPAVAPFPAHEDWRDRWRYPSESRTGPNQLAAAAGDNGGRPVKLPRYYWLLLADGHLTRQR